MDLSLINPLSVTTAPLYNNIQGLRFQVTGFYEILGSHDAVNAGPSGRVV